MAKSDLDHAGQMLAMAKLDFVALENMLDRTRFSEGVFGFHAQQATEKGLKAWIASRGLEYPKSHDLSVLMRILTAAGQSLSAYPDLEDLTIFAVQYRYEAYDVDDEALDRQAVLKTVENLLTDAAAAISGRGRLPQSK